MFTENNHFLRLATYSLITYMYEYLLPPLNRSSILITSNQHQEFRVILAIDASLELTPECTIIAWLNAVNHKLVVHDNDMVYLNKMTLLEVHLQMESFVKKPCLSSYIIHVANQAKVDNTISCKYLHGQMCETGTKYLPFNHIVSHCAIVYDMILSVTSTEVVLTLSLTLTQLKQAGRQYSWTEKSQKDRATEGEIKKQ